MYILYIIRVSATVYSSVHWHKAAVTSPTWDGHHDWSDLVETMAEAIQPVQTYTIKFLSLRT